MPLDSIAMARGNAKEFPGLIPKIPPSSSLDSGTVGFIWWRVHDNQWFGNFDFWECCLHGHSVTGCGTVQIDAAGPHNFAAVIIASGCDD